MADDPQEHPPDAVPTPGRRWVLVSALLAVLLVASLVALGLVWRDRADLRDEAAAEAAATQEAERIVVAWLSYDHRTYEDDMSWVTESGTEKFAEDYSPEALQELRTQMIGPRQLISEGRVVRSAATVEDAEQVTVLVFTEQSLTDKDMRRSGDEPLRARSGVELRMVQEDGTWLVDDLVQLQFQ